MVAKVAGIGVAPARGDARIAIRRSSPFAVVVVVALASVLLPPGPRYPGWLAAGGAVMLLAGGLRGVNDARRLRSWLGPTSLVLGQAAIGCIIYAAGPATGLSPLFILAPVYAALYAAESDSAAAVLAGVATVCFLGVITGSAPAVVLRSTLLWATLLSMVGVTIHSLRARVGVTMSEAEERTREISVLEYATRALTYSLDPDQVIQTATGLAATLASPSSGAARRGQYFELAGDHVVIAADSDETGASAVGTTLPIIEHPYLPRVLESCGAVAGPIDPEACGPEVRRSVTILGVTHGAYVPISIEGSIVGVLTVSSRGHAVGPMLVRRLEALRDLTELALANALAHRRTEDEATTDSLTGLANRRGFDLAVSRVSGRRAFAFLVADIDGLKAVNDVYGHAAGDHLISAVASSLRSIVRRGDTLARIGGDEFAIVMPDATEESPASMASRLADAVAEIALPSGRVSVSIGFAVGAVSDDPGRIMHEADSDLYVRKRAKGAGSRRHERQNIEGITASMR